MAEIKRKQQAEEAKRKKREAAAKAEAERRKKEREERERAFKKQREEAEQKASMRKIVKLKELRNISGKEIKERLVALGHTVSMCIEKEDFVKKYCVVTGQVYESPVRQSGHQRDVPSRSFTGDGSYSSFEEKVRGLSIKELRQFVVDRSGSDGKSGSASALKNIVEKSELIEEALKLYQGIESGGVKMEMGRTQFAFKRTNDENEQEHDRTESDKYNAMNETPFAGGDGRKSEKENENDVHEKGGKKDPGDYASSPKATTVGSADNDVTLEDVVNEYRQRLGRTAFGMAGVNFDEDDQSIDEEEEDQEHADEVSLNCTATPSSFL